MIGFSESPPLLFILIGNFQSTPFVSNTVDIAKYRESFDQLANLIAMFPNLAQNSHFVFVPGPNDPWAPDTLPRPPLPTSITNRLRSKIRNVHFPGNPCRIKYFSQDIVIFREDLVNSLIRNAILQPDIENEHKIEYHVQLLIGGINNYPAILFDSFAYRN